MLHERLDERELAGGQVDLVAGERRLVGTKVELELAVLQHQRGFRPRLAPQPPAYASDELLEAERLGDVVVGAVLEALHGVGDRGTGRQHDDRDPTSLCAYATQHLEAVHVGQADVNGFEVLRRVRAQGSRFPVIMLTARSSVTDTV